MQMALYHHRWGYYSRLAGLGESGDFYTSPELYPLFAAAVAVRASRLWEAMGSPDRFDFVEAGGGSGRFARDFLLYVEECLPEFSRCVTYRIDDRAPGLRKTQHQRLIEARLDRRVRWSDGSPAAWSAGSIRGMILANELLDALSVHLVTGSHGAIRELYVRVSENGLVLEPGPLSTPELDRYLESRGVAIPDGVQWEINLNAGRWIRRSSRALSAGGMLIVDYGYDTPNLFSPGRPGGTLLCYARHTVHSDPLRDPGNQDMTTHIDLTGARSELAVGGLAVVEDRLQVEALGAQPLIDWRDWTLGSVGPWAWRSGLARSADALVDPTGLGRLRWILGVKGPAEGLDQPMSAVPTPMSQGLLGDHLALPDPAQLDPIADIDSQWRELWEGADESDKS
jgi:SAM-dependent MidA family methyltransferase